MPRYKATGNATLVGRFSSAVGTTRDDSKDRPPGACISYVVSVIGPASVCQRKAPLTSAIFLFVERCEAFAVILRAASPCHPPASRPAPCVHPRKGVGQIRNLFQFAMLFEKSKEKSKIRTWYHKSFLSTSRLSEGGRGEAVQRVQRRRTRSATSPVSWAKQSTRSFLMALFILGVQPERVAIQREAILLVSPSSTPPV